MPIDMPSPAGFVRSSFGLEAHTQVFTSPLTRNTQRLVLGGARWTASYTIRRMRASEHLSGRWLAFFLRCEGMANAFNAYNPDRQSPRGAGGGSPKVFGGGQTGSSLSVYDCPASVTGWLRAGDFFSANGELKMLTQDVDTNAFGTAILPFAPALRNSPPGDTPILTDRPTCTMILADDSQGTLIGDNRGVYEEHTFNAVEVF